MDYRFYKWWSMNDKAAGLPHLKVVQSMLEVVISEVHHLCGEPSAMYGLGVEIRLLPKVRP